MIGNNPHPTRTTVGTRRPGETAVEPDLDLPTLGPYLRRIRESIHPADTRKHLSREKAASRVGLSAAYLRQIEDGNRVPTLQALQLLASGYCLSAAQVKHIRELREPAIPLIGLDTLRAQVGQTPQILERLDHLDGVGILAGYFSPLWDVLAINNRLEQALPGLRDAANLVVWHFLPPARQVLANWDLEATQIVLRLKTILGRHRTSTASRKVLTRLQCFEEFRTRWTDSMDVTYRRDPWRPLRLHTITNHTVEVSIETSTVSDTHGYRRLLLGIRRPLDPRPQPEQ
ncbi:helix-turn-helix domain-containing protein [Nocardia sp. CNY236]|uniref:helix-turn-helix domain-containing protein n=1 Tax=Nocardia sp. CNY236 TaxID=1169152 RepID=UPI0003F7CDD2|nr:helix-turn-helix domain-containing protein [Nocardia sp. CNY236]